MKQDYVALHLFCKRSHVWHLQLYEETSYFLKGGAITWQEWFFPQSQNLRAIDLNVILPLWICYDFLKHIYVCDEAQLNWNVSITPTVFSLSLSLSLSYTQTHLPPTSLDFSTFRRGSLGQSDSCIAATGSLPPNLSKLHHRIKCSISASNSYRWTTQQ